MWMGEVNGCTRTWSKRELPQISSELIRCNSTRPSEIHRSIRNLDVIRHWKGTEFRTILLYVGIVVLKKHLPEKDYELFKNLFCAYTICSTNAYQRYLPIARHLFIDFIESHIEIYGENSITMNIHNTSHVVDDVENFGPLATISAYAFENELHNLKLRLKKCDKPLQQIARRVSESSSKIELKPKRPSIILERPFVILEHEVAYRQVEFKENSVLSSLEKNKWFLTHANDIVEFHFIIKKNNDYIIRGSPLKTTKSFFEQPFDSKRLNIFLCDKELQNFKYFKLSDIKAKMFCMPYENMWVFVPLLHTL